jgi:hypothetical protein
LSTWGHLTCRDSLIFRNLWVAAAVVAAANGEAGQITTKYTELAMRDGARLEPGALKLSALFKLYRDRWSGDFRFGSFHWLQFLGIAESAMSSIEALDQAHLSRNNTIALKFVGAPWPQREMIEQPPLHSIKILSSVSAEPAAGHSVDVD